jgi:hypothetical protein
MVSRLCHVAILWEGDAYPLAASQQMLDGKMLYREIWFDKPPVLPLVYLMWGARAGIPLRVADTLFAMLACWLAYRFARDAWGEKEGLWAAGLLGFFFVFDVPSAAIPVASDLMMVVPHLAAVWLAYRRRPFWSGAAAAAAFWINPKGVFVAAACALWDPAGIPLMAAGFAAVSGVAVAALASGGALPAYSEQVWRWGRLYAASPFVESPLRNGFVRTANWAGFHIAVIGAAVLAIRKAGWRWAAWIAIAALGVAAGLRFFPRYYFLLLPPIALLAARGLAGAQPRLKRIAIVALLLIPLVRFAPSYVTAARNSTWRDTGMDRDSSAAAAIVKGLATAHDSLFVWGYRPEIYVYTGLPAATMYLDSQPLSGVPADRHLTQSTPIETVQAASRRASIVSSRPTFIVDGLGPYNPQLAIGRYPELANWLRSYKVVGQTGGTVIYQLLPHPAGGPLP